MRKLMKILALAMALASQGYLGAHCQMPCGIYHDDMMYDRIDQYVETMYKGVSILKSSKFSDAKERNEFVRWVMQKDQASDEVANLITQYFLQQKIKPGEEDTTKRLIAAHNLLYQTVCIKQAVDLKFVEDFSDQWEKFKLMFHREGYECDMEKIRLQKEVARREAAGISDAHDHDHTHDYVQKDEEKKDPSNK